MDHAPGRPGRTRDRDRHTVRSAALRLALALATAALDALARTVREGRRR